MLKYQSLRNQEEDYIEFQATKKEEEHQRLLDEVFVEGILFL